MTSRSVDVNGYSITADEIHAEAARLREQAEKQGTALTPEERLQLREQAIDFLVNCKLLLGEARRLNLTAAEESLLLRQVIDRWSSEVPRPQPSEVREFYRENREQFRTDDLAWAAHIVKHTEGEDHVAKREEVERLRERVLAGEPFNEVASRASDCPENGGDLGYFARGAMVEEFEEVIFSSPLNTLTQVFKTRFGYHVAIVYDIKTKGLLPLDDVRVYVERILHRRRQEREIDRRLEALRSKAVIRVV